MKLILSLLTLFIFVSCTSNDTSDFELNQNLYENNKLEDFELFENANKFISQGEYDLALIELEISFIALYTSITLLPSIVLDSIPYPKPLSDNFLQLYCSEVGVESPYPLFSIKKITGSDQTDATFKAS